MKKRLFFSLFLIPVLAAGLYVYKSYFARPYLTVMGYVRMADGLGRQTAELIAAFKEEMSIGFVPTHRTRKEDVPEGIWRILKNRKRPLGKVILFEDCLFFPGHLPYQKFKTPAASDQIRIAYSMFESTEIPPEWTLILNTYFDAVVVPDPFLIPVYKKCGVQIPIFMIPLALDLSGFLNRPLKERPNTPFTFANLSSCVDRKNQLTLLKAFARAFGNSEKVRLIIQARSTFNKLERKIAQEIEALGLTNVRFAVNPLTKEEYGKLFESIDCYVNLSKGEGFSIQPREAMALGIPAIVTDNTAQTTLCKSGLVTAVPSPYPESAFYDWGRTYGFSFGCSVDEAADALKKVYDNYSAYLQQGKAARQWVRQYEYSALKPLYLSLIKPKKVLLGKENRITEEYLMTTSFELLKKYQKIARSSIHK